SVQSLAGATRGLYPAAYRRGAYSRPCRATRPKRTAPRRACGSIEITGRASVRGSLMDGNGAYRSGAMGSGIRPDTIIFAKNVHTNDPTRPVAEAIAIIGQTIVAVGSRREAAEWDHQEARIFDIPD